MSGDDLRDTAPEDLESIEKQLKSIKFLLLLLLSLGLMAWASYEAQQARTAGMFWNEMAFGSVQVMLFGILVGIGSFSDLKRRKSFHFHRLTILGWP